MKNNIARILFALVLGLLIYSYFAFDLGQYFTLDYVKAKQSDLAAYYLEHQIQTIIIYMAVYISVTALSLPGAAILTLVGGALLGLTVGTVVISFASTIGATLAFLVSRFLLRDYVQSRFKEKLRAINAGIEKEGNFYLFTLRLIPAFPFFVINLVMGLTPIKTINYFIVSQIGMLPGTLVYVNAGTQLAQIDSLRGILSPGLIASFIALGLFPLLAKKFIDYIKARRVLRKFRKPRRFDFNIVVVGAGSGGLVSAYIASAVKAKVALVEKHKMGGDCLNTGCVPSKALLRSAKMLAYSRRAAEYGFRSGDIFFNFGEVMERVQRVINTIEPHDSVERYTGLGVECFEGEAKIISPYEVKVNDKILTTRNIIVATGGRPRIPAIPGIEEIPYFTSDTLWDLRTLPKRLLVLGGGPIGCELAQAFRRFGAEVTLVQRNRQLLPAEDTEVAAFIAEKFRDEGIEVHTGTTADIFYYRNGNNELQCTSSDGEKLYLLFDAVILALGREANTQGFGLEELQVRLNSNGTINADEFMRTNYPNIYVCGDVTGPYQFTHVAAHQAWFAAVNALFSPLKKFQVDYRVIPWATYTDPEVARVGLNEAQAVLAGIPFEVTRYGIDDLDRAIADEEATGMVKVLTVPGKDKIIGVTIVGNHASDIIAEFVLAMKYGIGLNKILGTIHIYPTLAEANKYVAGNWKRNHAPLNVLRHLQRFHSWRR